VTEILVTGGNGFLGSHVVKALRERSESVRVLALPREDTRSLEMQGVDVYRGDIRDPEAVLAAMNGAEGVLHLAGMMGLWRPLADYRAVNVMGTENVCRAALTEGARVVHVSSWTVYGMGLGEAVREDRPLRPLREPYAMTKAEGDISVQRMIAEDQLRAVIIRPGTIFGPGSTLNFRRIADRLRAGRWIIVGSGRNALPLVYVSDVVRGLLLALDQPDSLGKAYNIGNDLPLSQEEFLTTLAREIGARPPRLRVPYRVLYTVASVAERLAEMTGSRREPIVTRHGVNLFGTDNRHAIDKARSELGYTPKVPLAEGILHAAAWYGQVASAPRGQPMTRSAEPRA